MKIFTGNKNAVANKIYLTKYNVNNIYTVDNIKRVTLFFTVTTVFLSGFYFLYQ